MTHLASIGERPVSQAERFADHDRFIHLDCQPAGRHILEERRPNQPPAAISADFEYMHNSQGRRRLALVFAVRAQLVSCLAQITGVQIRCYRFRPVLNPKDISSSGLKNGEPGWVSGVRMVSKPKLAAGNCVP